LVIDVFPCVSANILAGVNSKTTYLKELLAPIFPNSAKASSSRLIPSVEALIPNIWIISDRVYGTVLMIRSLFISFCYYLSNRSMGTPCGDLISDPLIVQIPLLVAKMTTGANGDSRALFK